MKLFDVQCESCGHTWEDMANKVGDVFKCTKCGNRAKTVISRCNFKLDGTDPGFPTAYDQWATRHERMGRG